MCKFLTGSLMRAFNPPKPECFLLLPVLCANESSELEPNLSRDCSVTLACLAQSLLPPSALSGANGFARVGAPSEAGTLGDRANGSDRECGSGQPAGCSGRRLG